MGLPVALKRVVDGKLTACEIETARRVTILVLQTNLNTEKERERKRERELKAGIYSGVDIHDSKQD